MKKLKLLIMLLVVSEMSFTYCKPGEEANENATNPLIIKNDSNEHIHEYNVIVSARNWRMLNCKERFVDLPIKEITETVLDKGLVMVYLIEGEKYLALPFNYYQVRRVLSFQPSFEPGHAYINIFGNFILNVSAKYEFKVLIISEEILNRNKNKNWNELFNH